MTREHNVNPKPGRCVRCGKNAYNRKLYPACMTTGDYVENWQTEDAERRAHAADQLIAADDRKRGVR